jgi:soluble lytic murein transglycosylase-like protein
MGALRAPVIGLVLVAVVLCAEPARGAEASLHRWDGLIAEASRRFRIPEDWIRSVMRVESTARTESNGRPIVSSAGAMGLMQLMPGTWAAMRGRYGLGVDPFDPHDNIFAGTAYLRELYDKFGFPGLFAAYNAGPRRLQAYRDAGRDLPRETRSYMAALIAGPPAGASAPSDVRRLFFVLGQQPRPAATRPERGLFVRRGF